MFLATGSTLIAPTVATNRLGGAQTRASVPAGMDPDGLSSLLLLTPAAATDRVLFLARPRQVLLQVGAAEHAHARVIAAEWDSLPLASGTVDRVVVDLDAVSNRWRVQEALMHELARVLSPAGTCVAVCTHRRRSRVARLLHRYRLSPPLRAWRLVFAAAGLVEGGSTFLNFEGSRLVALHVTGGSTGDTSGIAGDAAAIVLTARTAAPQTSLLEQTRQVAERVVGQPTSIERVMVRKIGKTALFLRSDDGRRLVARVPSSGIAASRAACNYAALEAIRHDTVYGEWVRSVVPAPWWRGRVAGVSAFLEECRPGEPRQVTGRSIAWEPQALDFITRVHQASAASVPLTGETYERLVGARVNAIVPHVPTEVGRGTLRHLTALLHERLHGRSLPLVRSHGDLTNENCLYDSGGRLVGVIDWELSQPRQLPLLDVVQSMDIAGESSRAPRWLRADLVFDAAIGEGPLRSAAEVQAYCEALGLQSGDVTPLLVMHWIDHVSARVQARCGDLLWMQRRVYQPLERLAAVVARW